MVDKIKREARERMARTGESYTTARRAVTDTTAGPTGDVGEWTWTQAADRLDALAAMLRYADQVQEHLDAVRALRPPRLLPGWQPMLAQLGVHRFGAPASGLVGATATVVEAALSRDMDLAYRWHLRWYADQAYALLSAASQGRAPVEVPDPMPPNAYEWPQEWWAPADARATVLRAGSAQFSAPVLAAIKAIDGAQAAAVDLDDWQQDKLDRHLEDGCDDHDVDGGCAHGGLGPAEHEIEAWERCEAEANRYEPAVVAFCEATRLLIRAHAVVAA